MAQLFKFACAIISTLLIASACVPIPHNEYRAPKISGTIYNGDTPLRQTKIYLSTSTEECDKPYLVGVTNDLGKFEIGPVKELEYLVFLIGDPSVWWSLCLESYGSRQVIMSQGGIGGSPTKLRVKCDVSQEQDTFIEVFGDIRGKCESIDP